MGGFCTVLLYLGEWGKMDVDRAWKFHARSKELHKIGSLRERLYVSSYKDLKYLLASKQRCVRHLYQ